MCNIDERERCEECGELFEPDMVKFFFRRKPHHEDCFYKILKKMRIEYYGRVSV